jgi:ABC-type cobalamin/Fe3+-siderophores transport system ATPase subunit
MSAAIGSVRDVSWRVGTAAVLERVSLDVRGGEFVAVLGRNGAGKSTLLDIIAGLRAPTNGKVWLDGRAVSEQSPLERARLVAHLPQTIRGDLSVRAEALVLMGRYVHATGWFESADDRAIATEAMRRCDCVQFRHRIVSTLSGGERQRVLLAACFAQRPRVLLLDEPATFLDLDQQLECFTLLREAARQGMACLAVTHDVNLAATFCSRLIVLAERSIAFDLEATTSLEAPEWLQAISPRLDVQPAANGRRWVAYR